MQKKVLKLKKTLVEEPLLVPLVATVPEKPKKVLKLKKPVAPVAPLVAPLVPLVQEKPKKVITLKGLPVPPIPTGPLTKAMEAFEELREYYSSRDEPIPQSDIKWFLTELEQEKKADAEFWADCSITKVCLDGFLKGATDDELDIAVAKAQIEEKKKPIKETDLGHTPSYGTPEFWAWCHKKKRLRLQKEAEIIAAGGTVPPEKPKKPRKLKAPAAAPTL
jgi:hypothetical protein